MVVFVVEVVVVPGGAKNATDLQPSRPLPLLPLLLPLLPLLPPLLPQHSRWHSRSDDTPSRRASTGPGACPSAGEVKWHEAAMVVALACWYLLLLLLLNTKTRKCAVVSARSTHAARTRHTHHEYAQYAQ